LRTTENKSIWGDLTRLFNSAHIRQSDGRGLLRDNLKSFWTAEDLATGPFLMEYFALKPYTRLATETRRRSERDDQIKEDWARAQTGFSLAAKSRDFYYRHAPHHENSFPNIVAKRT
jgi:hypothetical protein